MPPATGAEMGRAEIDEFVGSRETGVLTLARDDEPYSIPISYGYDPDEETFYLRLVSTPRSEKREFLGCSPVRLVIYDDGNSGAVYRSVVASGSLEEVDPAELSPDQVAQYGDAKRPLFEIWGAGRDELDIRLYELNPRELTGRQTEITRE